MKNKLFFTLLSACLLGLCGQADAQSNQDAFTMKASSSNKVISMNESFSRDTTLAIFERIGNISGLSITMDVEKTSDDFLVRILLEDSDGHKHLVAESYRELAADTPFQRFSNYCEETAILPDVSPVRLHIFVQNATVKIHALTYTLSNTAMRAKGLSARLQEKENLRKQQVQAKVDQINAYNVANNKLWRAGVTGLSLKSQEDKMRSLGFSESANIGGFEYYAGGIFEVGSDNESRSIRRAPEITEPYPNDYVPLTEFDWRSRHGRNWVTSVKDQGSTSSCTAYASVGALESAVQLYYNRQDFHANPDTTNHIMDLAEGDTYEGFPFMRVEGVSNTADVVEWVAVNGVHDELSNPWDGEMQQIAMTHPVIHVKPSGFATANNHPDSIKRLLREKGPLVSGYKELCHNTNGSSVYNGHAMVLIGYGKVYEGMELRYYENQYNLVSETVNAGNPKIGLDYFLFKNSYGENNDIHPPYVCIAFRAPSPFYDNYMIGPYNYELPINVTEYEEESQDIFKTYTSSDIICEDRDGDGFYFWGIGPRPTLPEGAFEEQDGDDGDPFVGPVDSQNRYRNLNPATNDTIDSSFLSFISDYNAVLHCYNNVLASDGNGWDGNVCSIYFHNGAKLIIDSGAIYNLGGDYIIYNADIEMRPGSKLVIRNGCRVILRQGASFNPPVGAIVEIQNGSIEPYIDHFPSN